MADNQRFKMTAYTGQTIESYWWGSLVIDVAGIQTAALLPALREHVRTASAGVIDQTEKTNNQLIAHGYFIDTRDGREIQNLLQQGFPLQASVGVWPDVIEEVKAGATVKVNGRSFTGPGTVWRKSRVREISFVALGADDRTNVSIAASLGGHQVNPSETFESKVSMYLDRGCSKTDAIRNAAINFPQLHTEYIKRYNEDLRAESQASKTPEPEGMYTQIWNNEIEKLKATGLSAGQAITKLVHSDPSLHKNYLSEINSKPRRR